MTDGVIQSDKYSFGGLENLFVTARREFKYPDNVFMSSLIYYDVIQNGVLLQRSRCSRILRVLH